MAEAERLGELIQTYARAKWGLRPDQAGAARAAALLQPQLRERIDVLGSDGVQLLDIAPARVLERLAALEREASLEDARAQAAAARHREREERVMQGQPGTARQDAHGRRGKQRPQQSRHGRHRPRGRR